MDEWKGKESRDLKKRGELIFDATLSHIDTPRYLAMHIPGEVIINRMCEDKMVNEYYDLVEDTPRNLLMPMSRP